MSGHVDTSLDKCSWIFLVWRQSSVKMMDIGIRIETSYYVFIFAGRSTTTCVGFVHHQRGQHVILIIHHHQWFSNIAIVFLFQ